MSLSEYVYLDQSKLDSFLSDRNLKIILINSMNLPEVEIKLRMMKLSPNWAELNRNLRQIFDCFVRWTGETLLIDTSLLQSNVYLALYQNWSSKEGSKWLIPIKVKISGLKPIVIPS